MNVSVSILAGDQRSSSSTARTALGIATALVLLLSGCSSVNSMVSVPKMSTPDFRLSPNTDAFRNRFYAGASFGSTALSPNTTDSPGFTAGSTSAGASQIRVGYDLHNRVALELDSSVLGETGFDQTSSASIKYSSIATSALFYAVSGNENRNRREKWSGYGRLGIGLNRTASNIAPLDGSKTGLLVGAGVEYGMKNGLGIRGEVTRFDSEATFLGLGIVFRFNSVKNFVPDNLSLQEQEPVKVASRFDDAAAEPALGAATGGSSQVYVSQDAQGVVPGDLLSSAPVGAVRVLASASDYDVDGVDNEADKCADTPAGTAVDQDGCGIFDGTLANGTFSNGSAGLSAHVKASLDNLAMRLIAFPEVRIAIEGHTDDKGPADINLNVSRSRAHMVRDYLIRQGVSPQQLETHAFGETRPVGDNNTEKGRDENRRIEFVTLPSLSREEIASPRVPVLVAKETTSKTKPALIKAKAKSKAAEPELAAAEPGIEMLPATMQIPGLNVQNVVKNVSFVEKSDQLRPESLSTLAEVASALRKHRYVKVLLAAHTNDMSTDEENMNLSIRQAHAVARELVKHGVSRTQLLIRGFGNTLPLVQELTEANRAENRRIELRPVKQ